MTCDKYDNAFYTAIYDKFDNKKNFFFLLHFFGSFKIKTFVARSNNIFISYSRLKQRKHQNIFCIIIIYIIYVKKKKKK